MAGPQLSAHSAEPRGARRLQAERHPGGRQLQDAQDHQLRAVGLQELLHREHDGGGRGLPQPAPGARGPDRAREADPLLGRVVAGRRAAPVVSSAIFTSMLINFCNILNYYYKC